MIYCFTGNGKGKTTAALGTALRAIGHGWKVCVIQFIKGTWPTGEIDSIEKIPEIDLFRAGKGFFEILDDKLPEEDHKKAAEEAIQLVREKIESGKYQLIILDEINVTADLNLIDPQIVVDLIKNAPKDLHFVLTGRNAPKTFTDLSDLVTEMNSLKHPYDKDIEAVRGLDF